MSIRCPVKEQIIFLMPGSHDLRDRIRWKVCNSLILNGELTSGSIFPPFGDVFLRPWILSFQPPVLHRRKTQPTLLGSSSAGTILCLTLLKGSPRREFAELTAILRQWDVLV